MKKPLKVHFRAYAYPKPQAVVLTRCRGSAPWARSTNEITKVTCGSCRARIEAWRYLSDCRWTDGGACLSDPRNIFCPNCGRATFKD